MPNEVCLKQIGKRRKEQPDRAATDTPDMFEQVTKYFVAPTSEEGVDYSKNESEELRRLRRENKLLKVELIYAKNYQSMDEASAGIFTYIEVFYNRKRRYSAIGNISPVEFEQRTALVA